MELDSLTIDGARSALASGEITATALAELHYERIAARDGEIHSFLALSRERALEQTAKIDGMVARGEDLPVLAGVPVGIKDVLVMRGAPATAGSLILKGYRPPYDATAVAKLEAAGAVLLGKLNCDEFAMGSSNENSAYGPVLNPRALDRVPGGSSGGSAAAVAADFAVATLGTDTGGSIRQPAAFCGVVGVLPTYGRVSRYGLIAFASSLDRVGPLTRDREGCGDRAAGAGRARMCWMRPLRSGRWMTMSARWRSRLKGFGLACRRSTSARVWIRRSGLRSKVFWLV